VCSSCQVTELICLKTSNQNYLIIIMERCNYIILCCQHSGSLLVCRMCCSHRVHLALSSDSGNRLERVDVMISHYMLRSANHTVTKLRQSPSVCLTQKCPAARRAAKIVSTVQYSEASTSLCTVLSEVRGYHYMLTG
jgi:hypothetical protein